MALEPGTRGYTKAIVAAQMLAQIGAFALPALLRITSPVGTFRKPRRAGWSAFSSPPMS
jgi:hypothetical protein